MEPTNHQVTTCQRISEMLARVGDKWTLLVIRELGKGPNRFNALQRQIGDISQKMLSSTLRNLERDGFVSRTVTPVTPPAVEYALTNLGRDFLPVVCGIATWTGDNMGQIEAARQAYDSRLAIAAE
ncbi:MAG: helix-turn-helix domain-containing protein [Deltaproteobacteria bacterium]